MKIFKEGDELAAGLAARSASREIVLMKSTMALVAAFMTDGDDELTAKDKVRELSQEITTNSPGVKYDFVLGDKQPLLDAINASILVHMTAAKKLIVTDVLDLAV